MTRFAVRQHDPLRTATGRRHHLNLLLHDYDLENVKTYGSRAPGLLSGTKLRDYPSQTESVAPHQARSPNSSSSVRYVHQLPSLTEQALSLTGTGDLQDLLAGSKAFGASIAPGLGPQGLHTGASSSDVTATPSWLTPQQLQNRHLGMKVAKMMNSHRTPIGAFANFDMPVAP
ncbi:hypothetical protein ABBQ38_011350 [Trebouxia sp. C0009 RCD-2024]